MAGKVFFLSSVYLFFFTFFCWSFVYL